MLVKPLGTDCNLGCTYCFYLEKEALFTETKVHQMTLEIQEEMQQSGDAVSFGWQGGEPALMGLDFYKRDIELEKKYGHRQSARMKTSWDTRPEHTGFRCVVSEE